MSPAQESRNPIPELAIFAICCHKAPKLAEEIRLAALRRVLFARANDVLLAAKPLFFNVHATRCSGSSAVNIRPVLLDNLVVDAEEQEAGSPLSNK
jgi:hypothetical protein